MLGRNHSIIGFLTALNVVAVTYTTKTFLSVPIIPVLLIATASAGAYKADLDIKNNKGARAGFGVVLDLIQKTPILKKIFGHRGFTHIYLIPAAFVFLAMKASEGSADNVAIKIIATLILGYAVGYFSHLYIDAFNGKGIPGLFPIPYRVHVASITSGTYQETLYIIIVAAALIAQATIQFTGKGLL